jgi:hypothetical protein
MKAAAVRLDAMSHPRSVAVAWWLVTGVALYLLASGWLLADWPYTTSREETIRLFWLVAVALPGLFLTVFGQEVLLSDEALIVRLGRLGLYRKRIPLAAIRLVKAVSADSMSEFSSRETGGHGRGMTCFYTQGRLGIEVITAHKRYFISCQDPAAVTAAITSRRGGGGAPYGAQTHHEKPPFSRSLRPGCACFDRWASGARSRCGCDW